MARRDDSNPQSQRVLLRAQADFPAKIFIDGNFIADVRVIDVSAGGLAFHIRGDHSIPTDFEIHFRLTPLSRPLRLKVEVRNRSESPPSVRIGCVFVDLKDAERNLITHFVSGHFTVLWPYALVKVASFLMLCDASFRVLIHAGAGYYAGTALGEESGITAIPLSEGLLFGAYVALVIVSFIKSGGTGKRDFATSVVCLLAAFCYLMVSHLTHGFQGHWDPHGDTPIRYFFYFQNTLVLYVGFSLIVGVAVMQKSLVLRDLLARHLLHARVDRRDRS